MRTQLLLSTLVLALLGGSTSFAQTADAYAWSFPISTGISAPDMIGRLREEVQKILNAGRLTPQRAYYADQGTNEEYWQYMQPGRIITTLAWAYPYLSATQRDALRGYVAAELADATHAPWSTTPMSVTSGARRELSPLTRPTFFTPGFATTQPSVHTLYGLWLYGWRSGDWALVQSYWTQLKSMYTARSGQGDIYGTFGAHVAMARLAAKFGDSATQTTALNQLQTQLTAGVTFAAVESRVSTTYWPEMYGARRSGGVYAGWMFLNITPEIARYLNDHVKSAVLARHASGKTKYPLWWIRMAPYFTRWTGDEGIGIPTEMMGMMMPIERWVVGANAATLASYMRSAPTSIGDCYWLDALVTAIEATGNTTWVDVRTSSSPPPLVGPAAPTNFRIVP